MSDPATQPRFIPQRIVATSEQKAIQVSRKRVILIDANAGAAKTTTLALRIAESLKRGTAPEQVVVLVFTNAAKQAMSTRLAEIGVSRGEISRLLINTFDELARTILTRIEGSGARYLTAYRDLRPFVLKAQRAVLERHGDSYALDFSDTNTAVTQFLKLQLRSKARMEFFSDEFEPEEFNERPLAERLTELGMSITNYLWIQEYERMRGAFVESVDFRGHLDATYDLVRLLEAEPEMSELLPEYAVIIADELHDLNEVTFRLLTVLIKRSSAFFCGAGDKDQVIYTWSGADHQFLRTRFRETFSYLETYPLTESFRYGPQLAELVGAFKAKESKSALLRSTGIALKFYEKQVPASSGDQLVEVVRHWKLAGRKLGDMAILLRDRHQSIQVEHALFKADIAYAFVAMRSFLMQKEVLMMRGMLAIACKDLASVQSSERRGGILEALVEFAEVPFSASDMREAKKDIAEFPDLLEGFITNHILKSQNDAKREATFAAIEHVQSLSPDSMAADALEVVADLMQIRQTARRIYVDPDRAEVVVRSIAGFIAVCRDSGHTLATFSAWLGAMERSVSNASLRDTVLIACIDQVKGLEFEHVVIPFLASDEFPRPFKDAHEEANRMYVAITRAKQQLTMMTPADAHFQSRFIAQMDIDSSIARGDKALRKALLRRDIGNDEEAS